MKTLAIIGCGALANVLADAVNQKLADDYQIIGFLGRDTEHAVQTAARCGAVVYPDLPTLLAADPDYVIELAGVPALTAYAEPVLASGHSLIAASIGALADRNFLKKLENTARASAARLYLISGAIGGFDVLQTISMMGPVSGRIDNEKAPASLAGAPYLEAHPLDPDRAETIFRGSVTDAIAGFPKNVNVAVATSLAADCPDLEVVIDSIPGKTDNLHAIHVANDFVSVDLSFASRPDPVNPRSSTMTAWSVAALLKNLASPVVFY